MARRKDRRESKRLWPLLVGSVLFGVAAALLTVLYLKSREAALLARLAERQDQEVVVVVANSDLRRGSVVEMDKFARRAVPSRFVHSDAVRPGDLQRYRGRTLTVPLARGKTLLQSHLDESFPVDFSDIVPVGRRAITVTVDEVNSIAGFVRPGNRIDVFVNIPFGESGITSAALAAGLQPAALQDLANLDSLTQLLASLPDDITPDQASRAYLPSDVILPVIQDVRVLATGRDPYIETLDKLRQPQRRNERTFTSVTLDVTPRQAALLTVALDKGDLLALLRNRKDRGAAQFSTVSHLELFSNAESMAQAEAARRTEVSTAAGVSVRGELVDSEGRVLATRSQLEKAGLTVNENGEIVDKDGNVIDPEDLLVTSDGRVMSRAALAAAGLKVNANGEIVDANGNVVDPEDLVVTADGKVLSRTTLAAAGFTVNENGDIVDANGRVVSAEDLVTTADGRVMTRQQLAKAGLTVNENGEIVDKDGNVVDAETLVLTPEGKVMTREQAAAAFGTAAGSNVDDSGNLVDANGNTIASAQALAAAGFTVREDGTIVDKDGNVVDPKDLVVTKDGRVLSKSQLAAAGLTVDENGLVVDKDGNPVDPQGLVVTKDGRVLSKSQLAAAGLSVDENGQIVDKDGNPVDPQDLLVTEDGRVLSKTELAAAGYTVDENGVVRDQSGRAVEPDELVIRADGTIVPALPQSVDLIVGGSSKDGVAKSTELQVAE